MIYDTTVLPTLRTLGGLSAILGKADAHCTARKIEPAALLAFRLFPDMLTFTRQVQLACDFAARSASRLTGDDIPSFPDTETSFAELQARIKTASAHISAYAPARFADAATRSITIKARGTDMVMTGLQFASVYAMPQFYFHVTTAYNILRHNGVEIGKMDYMAA